MNPFMIDPPQLNKIMPTRKNRWAVTKYTILSCTIMIGYIVGFGNPENALHVSALEYAFILVGTMALGYSLSAVADTAMVLKDKTIITE